MPITAGDFRNGVTFEMDGQPMQVIEFQHVKPGKGAAFVRTKYKNIITGAIREESFFQITDACKGDIILCAVMGALRQVLLDRLGKRFKIIKLARDNEVILKEIILIAE